MKRKLNSKMFALGITLVLMLTCSLQFAYANPAVDAQNGNSWMMEAFRKQLTRDKDFIMRQILELEKTPYESLRLDDYDYFVDDYESCGTYSGGWISDPQNIEGSSDGDVAQLKTYTNNAQAIIIGSMDTPVGGNVRVKMSFKNPDALGWDNYLMLYVSSDGSTWYYVNTMPALDDSLSTVHFGWNQTGPSYCSYVAVCCWSWYNPLLENWVKVDSISFETQQ